MNIAFFHIGENIKCPNLFCNSAKRVFQGTNSKLIQISDKDTPRMNAASHFYALAAKDLKTEFSMLNRMIAYRNLLRELREPVAFFDTDMLITRKFSLDFSRGLHYAKENLILTLLLAMTCP